jgi:mannose-1-phosphate guanylyltransferase
MKRPIARSRERWQPSASRAEAVAAVAFNSIPLFNLVLAAGAGKRLAEVTGGTPKQFWRFDGRRTLLDYTLDRCAPLAPPERTRIVIDAGHAPFVARLPQIGRRGAILRQPMDRGTAAGVLLGLIDVLCADADGVVMLMPSDQGVQRTGGFLSGLRRASLYVHAGLTDVVLFGITPDSADDDYGWIMPDHAATTRGFRKIVSFVEKPPAPMAHALFSTGAVWNTMVLVARASSLAALFSRALPDLWHAFEPARHMGERERDAFFQRLYPGLPAHDFSRDVLARANGLALYTWPSTLGWSDLGTPAPLAQWSGSHLLDRAM